MRKLFTLFGFLLISYFGYAQTPEKMSFQAIIRAADGSLVSEKQIAIKVSILQTSIAGAAIYEETHSPTTNKNGLVTFEIGTGSVISGSFESIDWGTGSYFIKTETDLEGGTNYTISGTSQLLSVPYALYAKKAANVFSGDYNDLTNKPKVQAEETYSIGDFAHGGVIFWLDESQKHGLVCSKINISSNVKWFAGTIGVTQAKGNGVYAGKANTSIIISSQVALGDNGEMYAARLCNELETTENNVVFGDWYLPSKYELGLMYQNKSILNITATANGGDLFANNVYWSSTEDTNSRVWIVDLSDGQEATVLKTVQNYVRAVRSF